MADLEKLRRNLESHGFGYRYFETPEEAADYLCASLHGRTVGIGGEHNRGGAGRLSSPAEDNQVFWHWKQDPAQARRGRSGPRCTFAAPTASPKRGRS